MGSGSKFKFYSDYSGLGIGVGISKFPHTISVNIAFGFWHVYIGFGKGYDE